MEGRRENGSENGDNDKSEDKENTEKQENETKPNGKGKNQEDNRETPKSHEGESKENGEKRSGKGNVEENSSKTEEKEEKKKSNSEQKKKENEGTAGQKKEEKKENSEQNKKESKEHDGKKSGKGNAKEDFSKTKGPEDKKGENNSTEPYYLTTDGKNPSKIKPETAPEDLQLLVAKFYEKKQAEKEEYRRNHKQEYLKRYMLEVIKKIAAQHAGMDKEDGSESYEKRQMIQHMLKKQKHKIMGDKYDLKDARYVQFFIDTSGVFGCGSNRVLNGLIPEVIAILERQGYECQLAACGNGFYSRDLEEDHMYGTRKTLETYGAGKVCKIACPTIETAAKMANEAEFSIILADFDGLSSICQMASLCQEDKRPYFLCTEDRYSWDNPTEHNWVFRSWCHYPPELVYDVSMDGNPAFTPRAESKEEYDY